MCAKQSAEKIQLPSMRSFWCAYFSGFSIFCCEAACLGRLESAQFLRRLSHRDDDSQRITTRIIRCRNFCRTSHYSEKVTMLELWRKIRGLHVRKEVYERHLDDSSGRQNTLLCGLSCCRRDLIHNRDIQIQMGILALWASDKMIVNSLSLLGQIFFKGQLKDNCLYGGMCTKWDWF